MQLENTVGLTLATGAVTVLVMLLRGMLSRTLVPPLVGYIALGFTLRVANDAYGFLPSQWEEVLVFLAQLGVVALLFRVGMTSNLKKLTAQLPTALPCAAFGLSMSGLAGFAAVYWLLGVELIPSLMVGTAFMATSVGVSISLLGQRGILDTDEGALVTDVAELDDIGTILVMALVIALVPQLHSEGEGLWTALGREGGLFLLRFVGFALLCGLFSMFLEKPIMDFSRRAEPSPGPMLTAIGMGLVIAAAAAGMGFSLAVGAFFAGLAFSRDPEAVKNEASLESLFQFLAPFFFFNIGYQVDPGVLFSAMGMALVLLAVGSVVKVMANCLPVWFMRDGSTGILVGLSMIPRAEIAMIVMEQGRSMGAWAVPEELYAAAVTAALATCLLGPLVLNLYLRIQDRS